MPRSVAYDEAPYDQRAETVSGTAKTTPSNRAMDTSTPPDAKVRVNSVIDKLGSKRRCLITNVECDKVTEYAHVLGHALEKNDDVVSYMFDSFANRVMMSC